MVSAQQQLEEEYCPPIDSALFSAIVSDFDLESHEGLQDARSTLDMLRAAATEDAEATFDPSGSARSVTDGESTSIADEDVSYGGDPKDASEGLRELHISRSSDGSEASTNGEDVDLDALDPDTKFAILVDVFPDMSETTISHVLQTCEYRWQRALDELLNQSFIDSAREPDGTRSTSGRGIDAFSEENIGRRARKGKRKGKNQRLADTELGSSSLPGSPFDPTPPANKWEIASTDVDFISSRLDIPATLVRSTYSANHSSVGKTITHFLKDAMHSESRITSSDASVKAHAVSLGRQFPSIAPEYLTAIIRLTHPSATAAVEIASALTAVPRSNGTGTITPQYERISISDDESVSSRTIKPSASAYLPLDTDGATTLAASHRDAYRLAAAQAQASYRKSRSNHLMAGAAGYYSQVSRGHAMASRRYGSAVADDLVASQSSAESIDLHGVDVQNALRISKQSVEAWWYELGESRVNGRIGATDRAKGFTIITGVGRHSEGGKGKLGPAVNKMLVAEGWRVEPGSGSITVRGRAKPR